MVSNMSMMQKVVTRVMTVNQPMLAMPAKFSLKRFMKAADVLLIPSYSEAAPMVIDEAACLCTPVLSTGTCSAEELVSERGFGWVCGNSVEGITEALNRLLDSPQEIAERSSFLQTVVFDNSKALEGFRGLIGDEE